ncbi:unnamed protein product, partial [Didymodactylos carnosus]
MLVTLISFVILFTYQVAAFHFLGGTITWRPENISASGNPVKIIIIQTYSWTDGRIVCTPTAIANSNLINYRTYSTLATDTLKCLSNCGSTSSGYIPPLIRPICTDQSTLVGTVVGQRSDIEWLYLNDNFTVGYTDNGWRPLPTITDATYQWCLSTNINLYLRTDGYYNTAPVATVMSPINIPQNVPQTIPIPVSDANGDNVRCRWSEGATECGLVFPTVGGGNYSLPSNITLSSDCIIVVTGDIIDNWYAITVMIAEFENRK